MLPTSHASAQLLKSMLAGRARGAEKISLLVLKLDQVIQSSGKA